MKKIIRIQQPEDAPLNLTWVINNICTNTCSYCPSDLHAGKNHHYDWENARKFFKILFDKYPRIHCSVSGGEPSVSPFLPEVAKIFYDAGHTIGVTSNAARSVDYWTNIAPYLNYVCFSYHPETPDASFIEKVRATSSLTPTTVRIMMLPDRWDHCIEMFDKCYAYNDISVEAVRILNWWGVNKQAHVYSDEQLKWFDIPRRQFVDYKAPNIVHPKISADAYLNTGEFLEKPNAVDLINQGLTNFKDYNCEIGLKSLFVYWDGNIRRGNCSVGGFIGNINSPDHIQWPVNPVTCTTNLCHCATDVYINKWITE